MSKFYQKLHKTSRVVHTHDKCRHLALQYKYDPLFYTKKPRDCTVCDNCQRLHKLDRKSA